MFKVIEYMYPYKLFVHNIISVNLLVGTLTYDIV